MHQLTAETREAAAPPATSQPQTLQLSGRRLLARRGLTVAILAVGVFAATVGAETEPAQNAWAYMHSHVLTQYMQGLANRDFWDWVVLVWVLAAAAESYSMPGAAITMLGPPATLLLFLAVWSDQANYGSADWYARDGTMMALGLPLIAVVAALKAVARGVGTGSGIEGANPIDAILSLHGKKLCGAGIIAAILLLGYSVVLTHIPSRAVAAWDVKAAATKAEYDRVLAHIEGERAAALARADQEMVSVQSISEPDVRQIETRRHAALVALRDRRSAAEREYRIKREERGIAQQWIADINWWAESEQFDSLHRYIVALADNEIAKVRAKYAPTTERIDAEREAATATAKDEIATAKARFEPLLADIKVSRDVAVAATSAGQSETASMLAVAGTLIAFGLLFIGALRFGLESDAPKMLAPGVTLQPLYLDEEPI